MISAGGPDYDEYVSDPTKPVPFRARPTRPIGYDNGLTWPEWLVDDQREASGRPDVLAFTSDALTEPVKISGQAIANLVASTDGTDADWVVKLIDVYPDEVAAQPAMGGYQLMVAADIFRGRYRESFETPKPIEANRALAYRFALPTANHVFLPGHRIMVQVQSSWFPLYDRNPQSFVPNIFWAKPGDYRKAVQRIYHAPGQASYVELPMVVARCEAACGARNPASVISARVEGTPIWALLRRLAGAQSTLYSVVLPSKCSSSFSASARVWWTTPSR